MSTTLGLDDGLALVFGSLMAIYLVTATSLICVLPAVLAIMGDRIWWPRMKSC